MNRGYIALGIVLIYLVWAVWYCFRHRDRIIQRWRQDREKRQLRLVQRNYSLKSVAEFTPSEYESYVGQVFSQRGFGNVQVMGGTGDFGADVLCTDNGGQRVCVQCKKYTKPVGVSAVQEVIGARGFYGCQRAIVATTTGFTPAARQLAGKNGVELVIIN